MQPVIRLAWQIQVLAVGLIAFLIGCQGVKSPPPTSPEPVTQATLQSSINHIVVLMQENRSFDSYFGQLPVFWAANNFPSQQFDGMPANASNPSFDGLSTISAFHLRTECFENVSPSWNESHVQWNRQSPTASTATMDGYVFTAAKFSRTPKPSEGTLVDTEGFRAMGFYDATDLNYYYFMASNFATSDRWFSPIMTRTQANRLYLYAATSAGHVYSPTQPLTTKTIFDLLDAAGVTWKIYETDPNTTFLQFFEPYGSQHTANVVPVSQYLTDVQNGTLPSVAFIEGGYESGRDEHPKNNIQTGAAYVASLINALMNSPSWKDSVFILTYDEGGGVFDHVPPMSTVSPDGIPPSDLQPTDICTVNGGANCDFTFTGFRVPLIVVSPFTRKNFVSHTPADYTAILKLIETRFSLGSLTQRDAAQMDMQEFFDFNNPSWTTPPTPPDQVTNGLCDFQALP